MGQASNSSRNASLDDKKLRAAGRHDGAHPNAREDFDAPEPGRGKTLGAFGSGQRPKTSGQKKQPKSK